MILMLDGIFLIDKEAGMTSRKVDNILGKRYGTHAVGHLGTLDPFATGLLIVAINKRTEETKIHSRKINQFTHSYSSSYFPILLS